MDDEGSNGNCKPESSATKTAAVPMALPPAFRLVSIVGTADSEIAEQVRRLAQDEFHEDPLEITGADSVWEASALFDGDTFSGFVVYGVLDGTMSLRHIAVVPEKRGHGHGRHLVEYVRQQCLEQGIEQLSLFSQRDMVSFYKALGFHEVPDEEEGDSEDDLQVPMVCLVSSDKTAKHLPRLDEVVGEEEAAEESSQKSPHVPD